MRVIALAIVAAVLLPGVVTAQTATRTDADVLGKAEAAFQRGVENKTRILEARKHFAEATDAYRELHRRGIRTPALYRNLGNAAVLADRWPEAIWAYHVGLKLDPNDQAMRAHLAFARAKVLYPLGGQGRPNVDTWPEWLHRPKIDNLSWVLVSAYLLTWFAASCAFILRRPQFFVLSGILIALTGMLGAALWHELREADIDRKTPLVVLAVNTEFYRGNAISYPQHQVLPVLPRGMEVRQLHRRGNWLQIRLTSGEIGWIHAGNALIVEP